MNRALLNLALVLGGLAMARSSRAANFPAFPVRRCSPDAVVSGTVCMDAYEASVWRVPNPTTTNAALVSKLQAGKATETDLMAGGATQLTRNGDYPPCADNGQNCTNDIYAVSLPGVTPSASITWFQAQIACKNARKRLPSNAEWQAAVAGTPDPGPDNGTTDCNTTFQGTGDPTLTGARTACVSADGVFDMVGNLYEFVADWLPASTGCGSWGTVTSPTGDTQCLAGASTTGEPGVLLRGGAFNDVEAAGPFTVNGALAPSNASFNIGFRCAR